MFLRNLILFLLNSLALITDFLKVQFWLSKRPFKRQSHIYTTSNGRQKKLDLYLPKGESSPSPIILFLHGGGWLSGHHRVVQSGVIRQLERGYAVASMDYTFSYRAKWPTQLNEVHAAIRFLKSNAETFHINPEQIFLWGISAGGHLVATAGTSHKINSMSPNSKVAGVVLWYPPTDLLDLGVPLYRSFFFDRISSLLLGKNIRKNLSFAQSASPITYIDADSPPFCIQHGTWDALVSSHSSQILHQALLKQNIPSQLKIIPKYVHADFRFNKAEHIKEIEVFLDQIRQGEQTAKPQFTEHVD